MKQFSVSVIIPAYKAAATVGPAVRSVLEQTEPAAEIIVIDDGSPDDIAGALQPYAGRCTLIRQENAGVAMARNTGIERARGDLIAFLDADDLWEPHKLAEQVALFERYPELGLVASRWYTKEPNGPCTPPPRTIPKFCDRVLRPVGAAAFDLATELLTSTIVVRRDLLRWLRFAPELISAQDRDLWAHLVVSAPVYLSSAPLITYVLQPGSLSRSSLEMDSHNMLTVIHRHQTLLGRRGVRRWEATVFRLWAAGYLGSGQPAKALAPAWQRLRRQPLSLQGWWILLKSAVLAYRAARKSRAAGSLDAALPYERVPQAESPPRASKALSSV